MALRSTIAVTEPDTRIEFAFAQQFEDRLGRPGDPRYALTYTLLLEETALAIDEANNIERFNIEGTLDWRLVPEGADRPILAGREVSFTAYSATGSTISTLESERDAQRRLAVILADAVVTRLLSEAATLAP